MQICERCKRTRCVRRVRCVICKRLCCNDCISFPGLAGGTRWCDTGIGKPKDCVESDGSDTT